MNPFVFEEGRTKFVNFLANQLWSQIKGFFYSFFNERYLKNELFSASLDLVPCVEKQAWKGLKIMIGKAKKRLILTFNFWSMSRICFQRHNLVKKITFRIWIFLSRLFIVGQWTPKTTNIFEYSNPEIQVFFVFFLGHEVFDNDFSETNFQIRFYWPNERFDNL